MTTFQDLKDFFKSQNLKLIIAADAETRVSKRKNNDIVLKIPAGGVSIAFDPIIKAANGIYIGRGKSQDDKIGLDAGNKLRIEDSLGSYFLKRIFLNEKEFYDYYYGYSNQTLWPLCHVTFERPDFRKEWYESFKKVNQKFANAIKSEIKGKTFIWVNDYQLSLVPKYLPKQKDVIIGMFWHIPWPTWEVFRILPQKREILESMLKCDFIAFHRGYQARNFMETVNRELEVRIDLETNKIYYSKAPATTVKNLPMGIDTDVIEALLGAQEGDTFFERIGNKLVQENSDVSLEKLFEKNKVILGVDRLDYTKGLKVRLWAIDKFFERNRNYIGKVTYLGIMAPSREKIPSYITLKRRVRELEQEINKKYAKNKWRPINIIYEVLKREEIISLYKKADLCLVTPLDDGMNLVSKEFIVAASFSQDPGMLVLSQFAGSAIDLTQALIVNPYNIDELSDAIKKGLEMSRKEKVKRIRHMRETLEERNVYEWAREFIKGAITAKQ